MTFVCLAFENLHNLRFHVCRNEALMATIKYGGSLLDCISSCNARSACQSFVYYARLHMCGLYAGSDDDGTINCGPYLVWYGVKNDYPLTNRPGCSERKCNDNDGKACVNGNCRIEDCNNLPAIPDSVVLGNLNAIGKRRRVVNISSRQSYVITCLPSGSWNTISASE